MSEKDEEKSDAGKTGLLLLLAGLADCQMCRCVSRVEIDGLLRVAKNGYFDTKRNLEWFRFSLPRGKHHQSVGGAPEFGVLGLQENAANDAVLARMRVDYAGDGPVLAAVKVARDEHVLADLDVSGLASNVDFREAL